MYRSADRFNDLESGDAVLHLGDVRLVDEIEDDYAVIDGETMSKDRINNLFKSYEAPFRIVNL